MTPAWAPNRRAILQSLGVAVAAEALPFAAPAQTPQSREQVSCFVEEGGRRGAFPLVVGALTTAEPDRHAAAIRALRATHKYNRRLTFASNDRHKLNFAGGVLGYFAAEPGLRYAAVVVTDTDKRWPKTNEEKDAIYFRIYQRLIDQVRLEARNDILLRKRNRTATGRDRLLHEHLSGTSTSDAVLTIQPELSTKAELPYLSAFLAGCIRADLVGASAKKSAPSCSSRMRSELVR